MSTFQRIVSIYIALALAAIALSFVAPAQGAFSIVKLQAEQSRGCPQTCNSRPVANSLHQNTVVHTRIQTATRYQTKLKPIKDIEVGDEVLAWDELQAHDNAALAQAGQAAQTLQAAYQQASLEAKLGAKSASNTINTGVSSYENKSNFSTLSSVKPAQRYEKVTDIASSFKDQTLLHISLSNGQTIQATAGHPFKTREGWRDAVLLKKGGQLLLGGEADPAERFATILEIREEVKTTAVYNLEVANLHTFFVGVEGVVVHNGVTVPAPDINELPGFPGTTRNRNFKQPTWTSKKKICQWDTLHGNVEVFTAGSQEHLGGYDHVTGERTPGKPGRAIPGRRVRS